MRFPTLTKYRVIRTAGIVNRWFSGLLELWTWPQKTFGRIALMLALILIFNQVISYFWITNYIIRPQIDQTMYLLASEVRLIEQQVSKTGNKEQIAALDSDYRNAGIRLIDTRVAQPRALQEAVYYATLSRSLQRSLNRPTEVRLEESDALYAWIKLPEQEFYWLRVPLAETDVAYPAPQMVFIGAILFLSLLGGWWVARSISRPLKRLQFAAREVGRGDRPGALKVVGTHELKALTKSFNQMARDVEQLEEDRTLLLAGISHDLRTPITRIRLACEFLPDSDTEVRDGIVRDTEDMDEIIDQFIGFVRDGRDEPFKSEDMNEMLRLISQPLESAEFTIELKLTPLPKYKFKPLAMKRMVVNLIENSIRYGATNVVIKTDYNNADIELRIRDNGPGIDESQVEALFAPFKRGDSSRQGKGTGLGLAIVKRVAGLHEGEVTMRNHSKGGLEVFIRLPRKREQSMTTWF